MDPSKDLAAYGYGSVAWKERMESWKQKQERLHPMRNDGGGKDWDGDGDDADLPLYDTGNSFDF
jgi:cellulose synthase A